MNTVKLENIENKLLTIRDEQVLLDSDIATIYGVETKRINETVKNNPDKFPEGYLFELDEDELSTVQDDKEQKPLMRKSGKLISEILDDDLYGGPKKLDNVLSYRSLTGQGDDHEQKKKAT